MKNLTRALAVAVFAMIAAPSFAALMNPPPASHPVTTAQATTECTATGDTITLSKIDAAAVHVVMPSPELGGCPHFQSVITGCVSYTMSLNGRRPLAGPGDDEDEGDAGTPPTGLRRMRL